MNCRTATPVEGVARGVCEKHHPEHRRFMLVTRGCFSSKKLGCSLEFLCSGLGHQWLHFTTLRLRERTRRTQIASFSVRKFTYSGSTSGFTVEAFSSYLAKTRPALRGNSEVTVETAVSHDSKLGHSRRGIWFEVCQQVVKL